MRSDAIYERLQELQADADRRFGRPSQHVLTIRLSRELHEQVRDTAWRLNVSQNTLVTVLLEAGLEFLSHYEAPAEPTADDLAGGSDA